MKNLKQALHTGRGRHLRKVSVARRLTQLVVFQGIIVTVLTLVGIGAVREVSSDTRQMYRFQLLSIADIGTALEDAARLQSLMRQEALHLPAETTTQTVPQLIAQLKAFDLRYRKQWEIAHASSSDALKFRNDVARAGEPALLEQESKTLNQFESSLQRIAADSGPVPHEDALKSRWQEVVQLRGHLSSLFDINVRYAGISNGAVTERQAKSTAWLIAISIIGAISLMLLGLHVHKAIAPRIAKLVTKVSKFKEYGLNEQVFDGGNDEIAVLANALDAGFVAIAEREKEREDFLAVIAHELKTPMMSIQGFTSMLLARTNQDETAQRALKIVHGQAWRLSRLIEALFLAMKARAKQLRFNPTPFDFSLLAENLLQEIKPFIPSQRFEADLTPNVRILGDQTLLKNALWCLFTCSFALSKRDAPVTVRLKSTDAGTTLTVRMNGQAMSPPELDALFSPFRGVEYETDSGTRATAGLYLSREIARIHGGSLCVQNMTEKGLMFSMELPV